MSPGVIIPAWNKVLECMSGSLLLSSASPGSMGSGWRFEQVERAAKRAEAGGGGVSVSVVVVEGCVGSERGGIASELSG